MGSILSNNPLPQTQQTTTEAQNPITAINNVINQILTSANPQQMFNQIVANNQDARKAMDLVNQYGNGDPRSAFINIMAKEGKQSLGQQIMNMLNIH